MGDSGPRLAAAGGSSGEAAQAFSKAFDPWAKVHIEGGESSVSMGW